MNKNYCGNERTPKWLNDYASWLFNKACQLHDYFYGAMLDMFGDNLMGKILSKILADTFFLIHMLFIAALTIFKAMQMIPVAIVMFLLVLFGGWKSYNKGE